MHRSGESYKNNYAALKVPKSTVASIILGLPRADLQAKLSSQERRALVRAMVTLAELQSSRAPVWRWLLFWQFLPSLQNATDLGFMAE